MAAVNEMVLREGNGAPRPKDAPMGPVWLKCRRRDVASLGLHEALRSDLIYEGREQPAGEPPSAVICFPSVEEDVAPEVEGARTLAPNAAVLVFAPSPNLRLARAALEAGASGLLDAGMRPEQVLRAVRVALRGETVLPRGLLPEWLDEQRPPDLGALLSTRQREILELVAEGSTNAEVAGHLFLSESTIKQHLRAAYKALGVRNRTEAAALWRGYQRGYA